MSGNCDLEDANSDQLKATKSELKRQLKALLRQSLKQSQSVPNLAKSNVEKKIPKPIEPSKPVDAKSDAEVAKYLKSSGYDYALSVFLSEAGVPLRTEHTTGLTKAAAAAVPSLPSAPMDDVLNAWGKLENRYVNKLNHEVNRWNHLQTKHLKTLEEKLFQKWKENHERFSSQYTRQLGKLKDKEHQLIHDIHQYARSQDKELLGQRDDLAGQLRELDRLKTEMLAAEDAFFKFQHCERTKLQRLKEDVTVAQVQLRTKEIEMQNHIEQQVDKVRKDEQQSYLQKLQTFSQKETQLRDMLDKVKRNEFETQSLRSDNVKYEEKCTDLQNEVKTMQSELMNLRHKYELASERLRNMNDYKQFKEEATTKRLEVEGLKDQVARERLNYGEEKKVLEQQIVDWKRRVESMPRETQRLCDELEKVRNAHLIELAAANERCHEQTSLFRTEKQKSDDLQRQLKDHQLEIQSLKSEISFVNRKLENERKQANMKIAQLTANLTALRSRNQFLGDASPKAERSVAFATRLPRDGSENTSLSADEASISSATQNSTPNEIKAVKQRLAEIDQATLKFESDYAEFQKRQMKQSTDLIISTARRRITSSFAAVDFGTISPQAQFLPTFLSTPLREQQQQQQQPSNVHQDATAVVAPRKQLNFEVAPILPSMKQQSESDEPSSSSELQTPVKKTTRKKRKEKVEEQPKTIIPPPSTSTGHIKPKLSAEEIERLDEEKRLKEIEELRALQEQERQNAEKEKERKEYQLVSGNIAPDKVKNDQDIDPVMQQYMQMVLQKRQDNIPKQNTGEDDDVELMQEIEKPKVKDGNDSSDFDW